MPRNTLRFGNKIALLVQTKNSGYVTSTNNQLRPLGALPTDMESSLLQFENAIFQLVCGDGEVTPEITRIRVGEEITFGQTVRLLHVTSNSLVCENRRVRASLEKANHKVTLERFSSPEVQNSRWRILPRYKVRSEGQKICDKDVIILRSMSGDSYLHIASSAGTTTDHFHEANSSSSATGFSLEAYDVSNSDPTMDAQMLSCGDCLQLLHREEGAMIACVADKDVVLSPLKFSGAALENFTAAAAIQQQQKQQLLQQQQQNRRSTDENNNNNNNFQQLNAAENVFDNFQVAGNAPGGQQHEFPSASLFVIEQQDVFAGGPVRFGRGTQYRLKSLLTNHYLCISKKQQQHQATTNSSSGDKNNQQKSEEGKADQQQQQRQRHPSFVDSSLADQATQKRKNRRRRANSLFFGASGAQDSINGTNNNNIIGTMKYGGAAVNSNNNNRNNNNNPGLGIPQDLLMNGDSVNSVEFDINDQYHHDLPFVVEEYGFVLTTDLTQPGTIICFHQAADDPSPIAKNHSRVFLEFPLLRDGAGLWLCSGLSITAPPLHKFTEADDVDLRLYIQAKELLCASVVPQKDGVEILKVPPEVFQDLNFVVSLMPPFEKLRQALELYDQKDIRNTCPSLHLVEQVRENLSSLICHCTKSKEMNPLIREGTYDFAAQCRIAEQNIAPILLDIIELSLTGPLDEENFYSSNRKPVVSSGNNNNNASDCDDRRHQVNQSTQNHQHHGLASLLHGFGVVGNGNNSNNDTSNNNNNIIVGGGIMAVAALNLGNNLGETRYHYHHHHQSSSINQNQDQNQKQFVDLNKTSNTFMNTTLVADLLALQNALTLTIKLCFRLIRQMCLENETTSDSMAPHLDRLFAWTDLTRLGVTETLYEIFKNHAGLIDKPDDLTYVHRAIEIVKSEGRGSGDGPKLLRAMITCNGRGLRASQNLVGQEILKPAVELLVFGDHNNNNKSSDSASSLTNTNDKTGGNSNSGLNENNNNNNKQPPPSSSALLPFGGDRNNCPVFRLWYKSPEQLQKEYDQDEETTRQKEIIENAEKEKVRKNNNNNNNNENNSNNGEPQNSAVTFADGVVDENHNNKKIMNNKNRHRKHHHHHHHHHKRGIFHPDEICGVFIDMHNVGKVFVREDFSSTDAFEEYKKSETTEGVPIETFCAMPFGSHLGDNHPKNPNNNNNRYFSNMSRKSSSSNHHRNIFDSSGGNEEDSDNNGEDERGVGNSSRHSGDNFSMFSEGVLSSNSNSNFTGGSGGSGANNNGRKHIIKLAHVEGLARQFRLLAGACADQNEENIILTHELVPLEVLMAVLRFDKIPGNLRAAAISLITHAYIAIPGRRNLTEELQSVVHVMDNYKGRIEKTVINNGNKSDDDEEQKKKKKRKNDQDHDEKNNNLDDSIPVIKTGGGDDQQQNNNNNNSESSSNEQSLLAILANQNDDDDDDDDDGNSSVNSENNKNHPHVKEGRAAEAKLRTTLSLARQTRNHNNGHLGATFSQLQLSRTSSTSKNNNNNNNFLGATNTNINLLSQTSSSSSHNNNQNVNNNNNNSTKMMLVSPAKNRVALDTTIIIDEDEIMNKFAQQQQQRQQQTSTSTSRFNNTATTGNVSFPSSAQASPSFRTTASRHRRNNSNQQQIQTNNNNNTTNNDDTVDYFAVMNEFSAQNNNTNNNYNSELNSLANVLQNRNNSEQEHNNLPKLFARQDLEDRRKVFVDIIENSFISHIAAYLSSHKAMVLQDRAENKCINAAIAALSALIRFGWIPRADFVHWLKILTPILDGRDDIGPSSSASHLHLHHHHHSIAYNRYLYDEQNYIVMECKLKTMEAVNLLAMIVRADIVDRIVGSFEAGQQIPYVSEILDFSVGSSIHKQSLQLLIKREKREEDERNSANKGMVMSGVHAFGDFTSDLGLGVLEAVGVDQVVQKIGTLLQEDSPENKTEREGPLTYLSELIDVLLDNCLYEFEPVVAAASDLLLDLTNSAAALEPMMRRVQILPSAEAVKFYESIKPLQMILSKFENATISAGDLPVITRTVTRLTQLLLGDAARLAENHKIVANMRLHTVVASLLESTPLAFINAILIEMSQNEILLQQQQQMQQQFNDNHDFYQQQTSSPSNKNEGFDAFSIQITGASQANNFAGMSSSSITTPHRNNNTHTHNKNDDDDDENHNHHGEISPTFVASNNGSPLPPQEQSVANRVINNNSQSRGSAAMNNNMAPSSSSNNASINRGDSFLAAAAAMDSQHQRQMQSVSNARSNHNINQQQQQQQQTPNHSNSNFYSSPTPHSSYRQTPNNQNNDTNTIDANILAQAAAVTFVNHNNNNNTNRGGIVHASNAAFASNLPHNNNNNNQQQQQQPQRVSVQTSNMIQVGYRFLLAMLSASAQTSHEIQSDLIPFIGTFANQLPIATDIISNVLKRMFHGRIDICTSIHETAIQDISSMLVSCNGNPMVAHILRLLIYQEDQKAFDLIQSNAESVLRSLVETDGVSHLLRCKDFFTGKHAGPRVREALSNVDDFVADHHHHDTSPEYLLSMTIGNASPFVAARNNNNKNFSSSPRQNRNNQTLITFVDQSQGDELMLRFELVQTVHYCLQCPNVDSILKSEARTALFGDSILLDDLPFALDLPVFISALFLQIFRVAYLEDPTIQIQFVENPNFVRMLRRLDARLRKMIERIATMLVEDDNDFDEDYELPKETSSDDDDEKEDKNVMNLQQQQQQQQSPQKSQTILKDDANVVAATSAVMKPKKRAQISHEVDVIVLSSENDHKNHRRNSNDENNNTQTKNAMTIFNSRKDKKPKCGLFSTEIEWYWLIHGVLPFMHSALTVIGGQDILLSTTNNTNSSKNQENGPNSINNQGNVDILLKNLEHFSPLSEANLHHHYFYGNNSNSSSSTLAQLKISPEVYLRLKNISQHTYQLLDVAVRENINYELANTAAEALQEQRAKEEEAERKRRKEKENSSSTTSLDHDSKNQKQEGGGDGDNDDQNNSMNADDGSSSSQTSSFYSSQNNDENENNNNNDLQVMNSNNQNGEIQNLGQLQEQMHKHTKNADLSNNNNTNNPFQESSSGLVSPLQKTVDQEAKKKMIENLLYPNGRSSSAVAGSDVGVAVAERGKQQQQQNPSSPSPSSSKTKNNKNAQKNSTGAANAVVVSSSSSPSSPSPKDKTTSITSNKKQQNNTNQLQAAEEAARLASLQHEQQMMMMNNTMNNTTNLAATENNHHENPLSQGAALANALRDENNNNNIQNKNINNNRDDDDEDDDPDVVLISTGTLDLHMRNNNNQLPLSRIGSSNTNNQDNSNNYPNISPTFSPREADNNNKNITDDRKEQEEEDYENNEATSSRLFMKKTENNAAATATTSLFYNSQLRTSIRSPSAFYFMDPSQYDPNSIATVRVLPQSSVRAILDFVIRTFRQGRLEYLRLHDLRHLSEVVSKLNLVGEDENHDHHGNDDNETGDKNNKQQNLSSTTTMMMMNSIKNHTNTVKDNNNNDKNSSSIFVFTEWIRAINEFSLGSEGTLESTAFRTSARVILRKGILGHKAVKNMVRIVNSSTLSDRNRARLLMTLRQCIMCDDDEMGDATLVVSRAAYERNIKMTILSHQLERQRQYQNQYRRFHEDDMMNGEENQAWLMNQQQQRKKHNNDINKQNDTSTNAAAAVKDKNPEIHHQILLAQNNNKSNNNNLNNNIDGSNSNQNNLSAASSSSSASAWELMKHTLTPRLTTSERQNIFAEWTGEYQLGPKLVTLLSSSNKQTIMAALQCGNALLLDGNRSIQDTIYKFFLTSSKEDFFVYCRRFFVVCRDQIRDRRRTLKRWIDELSSLTFGLEMAAKRRKMAMMQEQQQQQKQKDNNNNLFKNNTNTTDNSASIVASAIASIDSVLSSMQLIEGLYDFALPQVLLRFTQLLCEGHNLEVQSYLRFQGDNQVSINVVESVIAILEELALGVDHGTFDLAMQTLATLTEFVQGPCIENQKFFISQNIGGVVASVFLTRHPLLTKDQLWCLQNACVTLLLALQEGHMDLDVMSTLIQSLDMSALVRCMDKTYFDWIKKNEDYFDSSSASTSSSSKTNQINNDNNNNIKASSSSGNRKRRPALAKHIGRFAARGISAGLDFGKALWRGLITGVAKRDKDEFEDELNLSCGIFIFMKTLLDVSLLYPKIEPHQAIVDKHGIPIRELFQGSLSYKQLSSIISTIEILRHGNVERVYFRVPEICKTNLQEQSKKRLIEEVDRTGDGGRLADFHERLFNLLNELDFYETMRKTRGLSLVYRYSSALDSFALFLAFLLNIYLVAMMSIENIDDDPVAHLPTGTPRIVYDALGTALCVVQGLLVIYFVLGNLRVHLNESWQSWQEDLNKHAIRKSKENLSIETPRIEDDPKSQLFRYEIFVYNLYFILSWPQTYQYFVFLVFAFLGRFVAPYYYCIQLCSVAIKFPQLTTVLFAVSKNSWSLLLTLMFLLVIVYIFAVVAYWNFSDMFSGGNTGGGGNCDTLLSCFSVSLAYGLVAGGGISDVVTPPIYTKPDPSKFYQRLLFDFLFFIILIILLLNLVFGIILDTFGQLREERETIERDQESKCFICGISRGELDKVTGFEHHIKYEHNMWAYLYFMKFCATKRSEEHTGSEGYVWKCMQDHSARWIPIGKSVAIEFGEKFLGGNNNNSNRDSDGNGNNEKNGRGDNNEDHRKNNNNNNSRNNSKLNNNNLGEHQQQHQQQPENGVFGQPILRREESLAFIARSPTLSRFPQQHSSFHQSKDDLPVLAGSPSGAAVSYLHHHNQNQQNNNNSGTAVEKLAGLDQRMQTMEDMLEKLTTALLQQKQSK